MDQDFIPPVEFAHLPLGEIFVDRDARQRRAIDTSNLIDSIKTRGVLNPIIVSKERGPEGYRLIAGERRYTASLELGLPTIPVRFLEDLNPLEAQIIELEENIKRQDLTWQEQTQAIERIHKIHLEIEPSWTAQETAESIGLKKSAISIHLKVASSLDQERIVGASTLREAYNILARKDARAAGDALEELLGPVEVPTHIDDPDQPELPIGGASPPSIKLLDDSGAPIPVQPRTVVAQAPSQAKDPAKSILHESFIHWAPKYEGPKFNFIHCDFPYGVNLFGGTLGGGDRHTAYDDTADVYFKLVECLCRNLDRLMSSSAHLFFWYSETHGERTRQMFRELAPSLVFQKFPLIWVKSDGKGIAADSQRDPRHVYETCLMASRGARPINKVVGDAYVAPTDKRFHVSTKPEPVLKHFFQLVVDEHTRILDPTCGSASALRAAEDMGAQHVLGMDIDEQTVGVARMALRQHRNLKLVAKTAGPEALGL